MHHDSRVRRFDFCSVRATDTTPERRIWLLYRSTGKTSAVGVCELCVATGPSKIGSGSRVLCLLLQADSKCASAATPERVPRISQAVFTGDSIYENYAG